MEVISSTNPIRLTTVALTDDEIRLIEALASVAEFGGEGPARAASNKVRNGTPSGGSIIYAPFRELRLSLDLPPLDGLLP